MSGTRLHGAPEQGKIWRHFGWSSATYMEYSIGSIWEGAFGTEAEEGAGPLSLWGSSKVWLTEVSHVLLTELCSVTPRAYLSEVQHTTPWLNGMDVLRFFSLLSLKMCPSTCSFSSFVRLALLLPKQNCHASCLHSRKELVLVWGERSCVAEYPCCSPSALLYKWVDTVRQA